MFLFDKTFDANLQSLAMYSGCDILKLELTQQNITLLNCGHEVIQFRISLLRVRNFVKQSKGVHFHKRRPKYFFK